MCGIIGQVNREAPIVEETFLAMRDTLIHRGPDDAGNWLSSNHKTALGHRRLSFLDLGPDGRQPMPNEDQSLWLTFNGEIYNFLELRSELQSKGHVFQSQTDSEVILHGYEEWGTGLLSRIKGMFAFGLWDDKQQQLFLARDRFGIKPLYWYQDAQRFIFASEIKGIVACPEVPRKLDKSAVWDYFSYRYVPSPKAIWQNMHKLPPAHFLVMKSDQQPKVERYWELQYGQQQEDPEELVAEMAQLLENSVSQHIRSDVPIGSFLSGGYDSSAMVYLLHRLKNPTSTFAIGFEGWDESEHRYAEMVAEKFGTDHDTQILKQGGLDLVEQLMHHYDEPIADISIIPTWQVSALARQKVKAVLSGEGADELFAGYTWQQAYPGRHATLSPFRKWRDRKGWSSSPFAVEHYAEAMSMGNFGSRELFQLFKKPYRPPISHDAHWWYREICPQGLSPLKTMQAMDIRGFMGELVLTKVDRASMAHSLEVRVPFLDHELFERFMRVDENLWYKQDQTKYPLFRMLNDHLPKAVMQRPKQGFVGPNRYYQNVEFYRKVIENGRLMGEDILNPGYVKGLVKQGDYWRLWKITVFEYWYAKWA